MPPNLQPPSPTLIRTDLNAPVFVFQTEFDISGAYTARQPDTNVFRQWEAAGTSHFDTYGLLIGPTDTGNGQGAVANLAAMQNPSDLPGPRRQCTMPINTGGAHWLLNSAIYWLNQWVTKGTQPPIGQPLQIASTSPFAYAQDANGNTLGGVRSPQVDAPIAMLGTWQHPRERADLGVLLPVRLDGAVHAGPAVHALSPACQLPCGVGPVDPQARENRVHPPGGQVGAGSVRLARPDSLVVPAVVRLSGPATMVAGPDRSTLGIHAEADDVLILRC